MTCDRTADSLAEQMALNESGVAEPERVRRQNALQAHLHDCEDCQQALQAFDLVEAQLSQWSEQAPPDWDRAALIGQEPLPRRSGSRGHWPFWQWAPLAASLVLALAVVFNLQIERHDSGWQIAFAGAGTSGSAEQLDQRLQAFAAEQQQQREQEFEVMLAAFAREQGEENRQLLQAAVEEMSDLNRESFDQLVDWIEIQRRRDLQLMEASFRDMLEREQQTVQSLQRLASHVQLQSVQR